MLCLCFSRSNRLLFRILARLFLFKCFINTLFQEALKLLYFLIVNLFGLTLLFLLILCTQLTKQALPRLLVWPHLHMEICSFLFLELQSMWVLGIFSQFLSFWSFNVLGQRIQILEKRLCVNYIRLILHSFLRPFCDIDDFNLFIGG